MSCGHSSPTRRFSKPLFLLFKLMLKIRPIALSLSHSRSLSLPLSRIHDILDTMVVRASENHINYERHLGKPTAQAQVGGGGGEPGAANEPTTHLTHPSNDFGIN